MPNETSVRMGPLGSNRQGRSTRSSDLIREMGKGHGSLEVGERGKDRRKEECKITRMSKKTRRNHAVNYLPEKERQLTHVIWCVTIHT